MKTLLVLCLAAVVPACASAATSEDDAVGAGAAVTEAPATADTTWILRGRAFTNLQESAYRKGNIAAADQIAAVDCTGPHDGKTCTILHYVTSGPDLTTRKVIAHLESVDIDAQASQPICTAGLTHQSPWGTVTFTLLDAENRKATRQTYRWSYLCGAEQLNLRTLDADPSQSDHLKRVAGP